MDIQSLFSLEGRIALVTGGSRGIGKMFVEGLLAAGCARVYISARKRDQMQETIDEFGADRVIGIPADLSQMDGMLGLANALKSRETRLDILINNAGAAWGQPYLEFNEAGWHRTMDLNVKTPFFLTQKLHDLLVEGGKQGHPAKVIHVSSIDGQRINPWETYAYQASKAAVIQLTRQQAVELGEHGIRANCVCPGPVRTKLAMAVHTQDIIDAYHDAIPLNRYGSEREIAEAIAFLCSERSSYITGQTLAVDGGFEATGVGLPALRK